TSASARSGDSAPGPPLSESEAPAAYPDGLSAGPNSRSLSADSQGPVTRRAPPRPPGPPQWSVHTVDVHIKYLCGSPRGPGQDRWTLAPPFIVGALHHCNRGCGPAPHRPTTAYSRTTPPDPVAGCAKP